VIDAGGKYVFPGVIDGHSHYGVYSDYAKDFHITSRAAAVGGVTTVINFMRSNRSYLEQLPEEVAIAEKESVIDFTFHLGVMMDRHLSEMRDYVEKLGVTSFKFYMGYKGMEKTRFGSDRILDDELLLDIFESMRAISPSLILCIHCENMDMAKHFKKKYQGDKERNSLLYFEKYSPDIAETEAVIRTSYLASQYNCKISIVHLSSATSVRALEQLPWVTPELVHVETCPQYLTETVECSQGIGAVVKPPIRYRHDQDALWEGIKKGIIRYIGTDNASLKWRDKFHLGEDIETCKFGFGGVESMFPLVLSEGYYKRGLSLQTIAEITSANTAKTYGLYPQKGAIEVGSDGDLVIVDLEKTATIRAKEMAINSDYTIYEGHEVKGLPVMTIRRGEVIAKDGKTVEPAGAAKFLKRDAR
jgi:dihydropyrimidinase